MFFSKRRNEFREEDFDFEDVNKTEEELELERYNAKYEEYKKLKLKDKIENTNEYSDEEYDEYLNLFDDNEDNSNEFDSIKDKFKNALVNSFKSNSKYFLFLIIIIIISIVCNHFNNKFINNEKNNSLNNSQKYVKLAEKLNIDKYITEDGKLKENKIEIKSDNKNNVSDNKISDETADCSSVSDNSSSNIEIEIPEDKIQKESEEKDESLLNIKKDKVSTLNVENVEEVEVVSILNNYSIEVCDNNDTYKIIHLIGIDMNSEKNDLDNFIHENSKIYLEKDKTEMDDNNGLLYYVWLNNPNNIKNDEFKSSLLNSLIIENGYSKYIPSKEYKYHTLFIDSEDYAIFSKQGVWEN